MELDKNTRKFLKALKNKDLNDAQIVSLLGSASVAISIIDNLLERKYIVKYTYTDETVTDEVRYRIYPYGEEAIAETKSNVFEIRFNRVISIISIVIAVISLIISIQ